MGVRWFFLKERNRLTRESKQDTLVPPIRAIMRTSSKFEPATFEEDSTTGCDEVGQDLMCVSHFSARKYQWKQSPKSVGRRFVFQQPKNQGRLIGRAKAMRGRNRNRHAPAPSSEYPSDSTSCKKNVKFKFAFYKPFYAVLPRRKKGRHDDKGRFPNWKMTEIRRSMCKRHNQSINQSTDGTPSLSRQVSWLLGTMHDASDVFQAETSCMKKASTIVIFLWLKTD